MDIHLNDVSVTYLENTPFEKKAIDQINLTVKSNTITGIIGHTGSGKSTLTQVMGALMFPSKGNVRVGDTTWGTKKKDLFQLRKQIGIVFQYPEHQLFEETVEKDIAFGPRNFGYSEEKVKERVKDAMHKVGLDYEQFASRSPFELSGGQMRRVAIAGVLAFEPSILILDEPTAGLDPIGRREILKMISQLHETQRITTILVSHSMDEVAHLADQLVVLNKGKVLLQGSPKDIFTHHVEDIQMVGLNIPDITKFIMEINKVISPPIPLSCFTMDELEKYMLIRLSEENK